MPFNLFIKVDADAAASQVAKVEAGLDKVTAAAGRARDAQGRWVAKGTEGATAVAAGAEKAAAGLDRVAAGADKAAAGHGRAKAAAEGHGDALSNLIHLAEAYVAVHQVKEIVDGYVEIRNKTMSVATSTSNLNALMEAQFRIAQETRTSWDDLASSYQRIANASRGLGLSQRDVLNATETIAMGMRLSGASSREAAMSMQELTHAFTVGALTGREYKVIAKDAPAFLHEIQVASGKTGAEFAEMGKKGKITAQLLVDTLGKAAPEIRAKFELMIPTIGEGFTLIRNAAEKFFGEAGVGSGVVQALGNAMKFLADHMETIGKVVLGVAEALIGLYVIDKIIVKVEALAVAIKANPLGILLAAVTVGIVLLRQFGDQINTHQKIWANVEGQFVTVGDKLYALWEMIKRLGAALIDFVDVAWQKLTSAFDTGIDGSGIELSLRNVLVFMAAFVDAAIGHWRFFGDTVMLIIGGLPPSIAEMFVNMAKAVVHQVEWMVNKIIAAINKVLEAKNYLASLMPGDHGPRMVPDAQALSAQKWAGDMNAKYQLSGAGTGVGLTQAEAARLNEQRGSGLAAAKSAGLPTPTGYGGFSPADAPGGAGGRVAANLIKPVDLNFTTAVDGAAEAFDRKLLENWKAYTKGTTVTKDMVTSLMDNLEKVARDHAAKRVMEAKDAGEVGTGRGQKEKSHHDDEAATKANKKYEDQLRAIEEATNPVTEAQLKLAHVEAFMADAVAHHGVSQEEATLAVENYKLKLEDALHPFDAWLRKQGEASDALKATSEETQRSAALFAVLEDQKKKGAPLDAARIAQAKETIAVGQEHAQVMRAEQTIMAQYHGAQEANDIQQKALNALQKDGLISATEYAAAMDQATLALKSAGVESLTAAAGIERAQVKLRQSSQDVGAIAEQTLTQLREPAVKYQATLEALSALQAGPGKLSATEYAAAIDANRAAFLAATPAGKTFKGGMEQVWLKMKSDAQSFGQTFAAAEHLASALVGDFDKLNDAIVTAANDGQVAWRQMVDSMLQDLQRLILKQLEVAALNALIGAISGSAGGGGAAKGVLAPAKEIVGASSGGGFAPVSSGGPGAYPLPSVGSTSQASTVSSSAVPVIEIHNHFDESVAHAAMDSPMGRKIVLNHLRAEQGAVRSYSGTRR